VNRAKDYVWESFAHFFGDPATESERGRMNAAVKQARAALLKQGIDLNDEEAVRVQVFIRYAEAEERFEQFGPMALVTNWSMLALESERRAAR
jgi:hypothetical protein